MDDGRYAVSLTFPTRNQAGLALSTLRSAIDRSSGAAPLQYVIVDDTSSDDHRAELLDGVETIRNDVRNEGHEIVVSLSDERLGVAHARNRCASLASGEVLFITDGHVTVCERWDEMAAACPPSTVLAGTVVDPDSAFHGYGCTLAVPYMGTNWVRERPADDSPTQVAASPATILPLRLFREIGGYDADMKLYGAIEPEFSLRAWLSGAEIRGRVDLEVAHKFKDKDQRVEWIAEARPSMIHNAVRFGMMYLPGPMIIEMLRYYALLFPEGVKEGFNSVDSAAVMAKRAQLAESLPRDFEWFCRHFELRDQRHEPVFPTDEPALA